MYLLSCSTVDRGEYRAYWRSLNFYSFLLTVRGVLLFPLSLRYEATSARMEVDIVWLKLYIIKWRDMQMNQRVKHEVNKKINSKAGRRKVLNKKFE